MNARFTPIFHDRLVYDVYRSQSSLVSNASDDGRRHLALVFFDILHLDGCSLLAEPYYQRRRLLESIVQTCHGYAMFAERVAIDMSNTVQAEDALRVAFARLMSKHEEGAVLKADESRYNDFHLKWVKVRISKATVAVQPWADNCLKLKADYIPGYGDCVDMALLGAGWDKDRARELRGACVRAPVS